jgi:hypothetical protein
MSFPWMTEAQRRKQQEAEEFARRAVADLSIRLHCGPSDMGEILRQQGEVNVLRPARRRPPTVGRIRTRRFSEELFNTGFVNND